jgi:hypothetical protein
MDTLNSAQSDLDISDISENRIKKFFDDETEDYQQHQKYYLYFKKYSCYIKNQSEKCTLIENEIQICEIRNYLNEHGLSEKNYTAVIDWINKYAKDFRKILNVIKLVYVMCCWNKVSCEQISFEDFVELEHKIQHVSEKL